MTEKFRNFHTVKSRLTFLRVSVSVSVPVDLELTGLKVPSTLSSRNSFRGDGGMAGAILLDFVLSTVLVSFVRLVFAVDVIRELFIFSSMLENTKKGNYYYCIEKYKPIRNIGYRFSHIYDLTVASVTQLHTYWFLLFLKSCVLKFAI